MTEHKIHIWRADWPADSAIISDIRRRVFIEEQNVPESLEWDGLDGDALHVLGNLDSVAVATGRLLRTGQIGRMAVLPAARGRGLGSALLCELLTLAHETGVSRVFLHAQIRAMNFYRRHGFTAFGPEFLDAGLRHRAMELELPAH